jgi:hypothetical protein
MHYRPLGLIRKNDSIHRSDRARLARPSLRLKKPI